MTRKFSSNYRKIELIQDCRFITGSEAALYQWMNHQATIVKYRTQWLKNKRKGSRAIDL
jgi:hypothetical protein